MKKIYWGLVLIAAAVLILLSCMGVNLGFIGLLPVTDILLAVLLLSFSVGAIVRRNIWFIPFPLAFVFMLFEKEIAQYRGMEDENFVSNWLVLLCALLISIGLSLIFKPFCKHGGKTVFICDDSKGTRFGSETKYIDCTNFENYFYSVNMGDGNVYFENVENYKGNGTLSLKCRMGNINVFVPSAWCVKSDIVTNMGQTTVQNGGTPDGPVLNITGTNKMGNIDIKYC